MIKSTLPKCFSVQAIGGDDSPHEIMITGEIGQGYDENWNLVDTEETILDALSKIPAGKPIVVGINSPGGRCQMSLGIYNALSRRRENVTTRNDGYALSSASVIMLAGSRRIAPKSSIMMVHHPMSGVDANGNYKDMLSAAEMLKTHSNTFASIYAKASGKTEAEMMALMDGETGDGTWMSNEQAMEMGFVNEETDNDGPMFDEENASASARALFSKMPKALRNRITTASARRPVAAVNNKEQIEMKKVIAALVAAGFQIATDATEDMILPTVNALISERNELKSKTEKAVAAQKTRVEARVAQAIKGKKVTEARKDNLVAQGMLDEQNLDFLDDIPGPQANGNRHGGVAPVRRTEENNEGQDDLATVRSSMREDRNPSDTNAGLDLATKARKARELRGHGSLFTKDDAKKN